MFLLLISTELVARARFSEWSENEDNCFIHTLTTGVRGVPNCVFVKKGLETQPVEYRFNNSGYRSDFQFGNKPPGTYRIVMVGSSFAFGSNVQNNQTFAALLPVDLAQRTRHSVELYNEGMGLATPRIVALRFSAVLPAEPDMVLWVLTPWDIGHSSSLPSVPGQPETAQQSPNTPLTSNGFLGKIRDRMKQVLVTKLSVVGSIIRFVTFPKARFMIKHDLLESKSQYMKVALMSGSENQFLRVDPGPAWQSDVEHFDIYAADMARQANAAGVPLVVAFVPNRALAAMTSMVEWPAGYDPYKLDHEICSIVVSHGATCIDILPGYREIPNPEQGYTPIDGHPNAHGDAIISHLLAEQLSSGLIPGLKSSVPPSNVADRGN